MTTVYFHGSLANYIESATVVDTTIRKAINLIASQVNGLRAALLAGSWHVTRGSDEISEEGLDLNAGKEIHIYPALIGASSGLTMVILGAAMIAGGWMAAGVLLEAMTAASVIGSGIGFVASGLITMFMGPLKPDYEKSEANNQAPSFLFNGPTNSSTQGFPVPVVIGRCRVGSVVVSAGLEIADLTSSQFEDLVDEDN